MLKKIICTAVITLGLTNCTIESAYYTPPNSWGMTPLMRAAGHADLVEATRLLHQGALINDADARGRTALMYAIYPMFNGQAPGYADQGRADSAMNRGSTQMVELLLKNHADIDQVDNDGRTALMHAVTSLQPNLARILLENNSATDIKDKKGNSVFNLKTKRRWPLKQDSSKKAAKKLEEEMGKLLSSYLKTPEAPQAPMPSAGDQKRQQESQVSQPAGAGSLEEVPNAPGGPLSTTAGSTSTVTSPSPTSSSTLGGSCH